jgi:hypothetical protein
MKWIIIIKTLDYNNPKIRIGQLFGDYEYFSLELRIIHESKQLWLL